MRRFFTKVIFSLLISLCIISTFSMYTPVSAVVDTYEDNVFSFKGTCNIAHHCTGMFMDVTVKATASNNNNETITLKIYVSKTDSIKTYTFLSDGQEHKFNNIFLGLAGGSDVDFTFIGANPEITINMNLKVVS